MSAISLAVYPAADSCRRAADGQSRMSLSSRLLRTGDSGDPCIWSPRGSKKKAPIVSPVQANGFGPGAIIAANCSPELKTYWSGVPAGQNPPPLLGLLI